MTDNEMDEDNLFSTSPHVLESLRLLSRQFDPIVVVTKGYREDLERGGWSQEASENMAVQYYSLLITAVKQALKQGSEGP